MAEVGALHLGSSVQKLAAAHGMDSVRGRQISQWMPGPTKLRQRSKQRWSASSCPGQTPSDGTPWP